MWLANLLRRPEKPEVLREREELAQRQLSLATADEDTVIPFLRDPNVDIRLAARSRLAQIRWSQGFRKTTVAVAAEE